MSIEDTLFERIANAAGVRISRLGEVLRLESLIYNPLTMQNFDRIAGRSASGVVRTLRELFPEAESYLDVGSGSGAYSAALARAGAQVIALEHSRWGRHMAKNKGVKCLPFDLTQNPASNLDAQFDVTFCFEVAEHLNEIMGERLVRFITRTSTNVVFTAAAPGQIGLGHINCQPKHYWVEQFMRFGFAHCREKTEKAVRLLRDEGAIYWLVNNMMVFTKPK